MNAYQKTFFLFIFHSFQTPIPNPQLKLHLFLSPIPHPSPSHSLQPKALAITRQKVFPDSGRLFHWLKGSPTSPYLSPPPNPRERYKPQALSAQSAYHRIRTLVVGKKKKKKRAVSLNKITHPLLSLPPSSSPPPHPQAPGSWFSFPAHGFWGGGGSYKSRGRECWGGGVRYTYMYQQNFGGFVPIYVLFFSSI